MSQNHRRDTFGAAIIGQAGTPTRIGRGPYVGTTYQTACQSWRCAEHQGSDVVNPAQHPGLAERHLTFFLQSKACILTYRNWKAKVKILEISVAIHSDICQPSCVLPQRADAPQVIAVEVKIDKGVLMKAMLDDRKSEYSGPSWHLASGRYTHDYVADH